MKLTTKGRYAVTAVLDLALHCETGPVTLAEIAERQSLSISYLEQLFSKLRRATVVKAVRVQVVVICLSLIQQTSVSRRLLMP